MGHSVFVTPDLQLASPTHAPVHATLAKVIHGCEFASNDNSQDRCDRRQNPLNLQNFNGRLLMCLGQCATCGCLGWRPQFRRISTVDAPGPMRKHVASTIPSTWNIVPGILSEPTTWIFYVDFRNAGFVRSDSTVPDLALFPPLCHNDQSQLLTLRASFDGHPNFVRDWIDCQKVQLTSHAYRVSRKRVVLSFLP